jgi:hypothetical protein
MMNEVLEKQRMQQLEMDEERRIHQLEKEEMLEKQRIQQLKMNEVL